MRRAGFLLEWQVAAVLSSGAPYTVKGISERVLASKSRVSHALWSLYAYGWPLTWEIDEKHSQRMVWKMRKGYVLPRWQ